MEKYTKKQLINKLKEGDVVRDIFVVKIKKSIRPYVKGYSFDLILSDASGGSLEYKYWGGQDEDKVKRIFDLIKTDSVVFIDGRVSVYNEKLQVGGGELNVLKVLEPEEYEAEFIMAPKKDIDEMYSILISKINSVQNEELRKFLSNIFEEDLKDKFKKHPGAIQIHHNWIGGLLHHTLEVLEYCETSVKLHEELDRDLLLAGAMLHDIGKLEELEITSRIKPTQKGQLIGHIGLGLNYVYEKLKENNLDEVLQNKLLHLIISNHGKLEFGSPKEPMMPEAVVLYYADELSSKTSEMIEFVKEHKEKTEDDFMYLYRHGKNVFLW